MGMLFCTNQNDFTHEDSYDGKRFVFEPGVKVPLSVEAAEHMFGFRQMDKTTTLHRLGWSMKYDSKTKTFSDDPDALSKLAKFIFSEGVLTERALDVEAQQQVGEIKGKGKPILSLNKPTA